jgi:hypothetical protein
MIFKQQQTVRSRCCKDVSYGEFGLFELGTKRLRTPWRPSHDPDPAIDSLRGFNRWRLPYENSRATADAKLIITYECYSRAKKAS